jgi:acetylornithine deacetylase/succinyl-diaminopimelate desuccinylase-like protein
MPFGTPGGDVQIQAMLQVVLNIFQHGMEVQDAIEAARFSSVHFPSSFYPHNATPGGLRVEGRIAESVRDELARRGLPAPSLVSGAGHDAMKLHQVMPQAMLFVRGENAGISHNPLESTTSSDMDLAVRAFAALLDDLARGG